MSQLQMQQVKMDLIGRQRRLGRNALAEYFKCSNLAKSLDPITVDSG